MKAKSFSGMRCSIAGALEEIGDRWAILVLRDLGLGLRRYDDLRRSTEVPTTTLAERLKHLESTGLVERVQYQDHPARFEYLLTEKGRDTWIVVFALAQWGDRWDASGPDGPPVSFVDRESGRPLKLCLIDAESGRPVSPLRILAKEGPGADETVRRRLAHFKQRQGATAKTD
jgi:DNA-binding HxlR family transcriptional regulator